MKIGIQTWGTEGDVRPFLALAAGLAANGHTVTLVISEITNRDFSDYGSRFNYDVRAAGQLELADSEIKRLVKEIFDDKNPIRQGKKLMRNLFHPLEDRMLDAAKILCEENDLVIGHFFMYPLKITAEKKQIPMVTLYTAPMIPSRWYPLPGHPDLGKLNIIGWKTADFLVSCFWKPPMDRMFDREGLPRPKRIMSEMWPSTVLNLISVSPTLFEKPPDWDDRYHVTGFLNVPGKKEPMEVPRHLSRFLESGPPPVYITFGSMLAAEPNPREITCLLNEAAKQSECRAVIQSNWDEIDNLPEDPSICRVNRAPHDQVFPKCAVVVHHGGAGTTQASALAGCPSLVVEHTMDQPFWANILRKKGLAPKMLHRKKLTPAKLARAMRRVYDSPDLKANAQRVGEIMKQENGLENAVALIEAFAKTHDMN